MNVAAAMTRQKHQIDAVEAAEQQCVGRFAPWRGHMLPASIFKAGDVINAAAADNAENGFGHGLGVARNLRDDDSDFPPPQAGEESKASAEIQCLSCQRRR
jgi:hypothetical protein